MKTYTLITGASSGIGEELARIAAQEGDDLVLTARSDSQLKKLQAELASSRIDIRVVAADLSDSDGAKTIYAYCKKHNLKVSKLINNAGFGDLGRFETSDPAKQLSMIAVNITSLTELTRLLLDDITSGNGKIMNVASTAAFFPGPNMSVYYATKHYVLAFSEALAEELRDSGVTVTALCPGPTKTGFSKAANASKSRLFSDNIPTAEQVARYGWRAMNSGKRVATHGIGNKVLVQLTRALPRAVITRFVSRAQR